MVSQLIHPKLDLSALYLKIPFPPPSLPLGHDPNFKLLGDSLDFSFVNRLAPVCEGDFIDVEMNIDKAVLTTFSGCPKKYTKYLLPPDQLPFLDLPVTHYDASIPPAITQSELDAISLRRRLDQISDLREDKSEYRFGQFEPKIPPEYMAYVRARLHVTSQQDSKYTTAKQGYYCTGISVSRVYANDDGNIVKVYMYPDEGMMLAYRQYKLAQIGLAPPVIELPDMLLNCSGIENSHYRHSIEYISGKAHLFNCTLEGTDFAVECRDKMQSILDLAGIYWSDGHTGNIGIYNQQIVIIDTGAMVCEEPHWERIPKCYKDKNGTEFSECKM
jgi:hypothetical protein